MSHNVVVYFNPTTNIPFAICSYCGIPVPANGLSGPCQANSNPQPTADSQLSKNTSVPANGEAGQTSNKTKAKSGSAATGKGNDNGKPGVPATSTTVPNRAKNPASQPNSKPGERTRSPASGGDAKPDSRSNSKTGVPPSAQLPSPAPTMNSSQSKSGAPPAIPAGQNGVTNMVDINGIKITVVQGDVVQQGTDCVVNAANSQLEHGGGVAGRIRKEGGPRLMQESKDWIRERGEVPVGEVAVTSAGYIEGARYVIHVVGPMFGTPNRERLLRNAIKNTLQEAKHLQVRDISIPAISTGIFNYPVKEAANVLVSEAVEFARDDNNVGCSLQEIRFVLFSESDKRVFLSALNTIMSRSPVSTPKPRNSENIDENDDVDDSEDILLDPTTAILSRFRAAGVLLYRHNVEKGDISVMLGQEYRPEGKVLNVLGGMKDGRESCLETAAREFHEESGKLISLSDIRSQLGNARPIWLGFGKYVLYLLPCPTTTAWTTLAQKYNAGHGSRGVSAEMEDLHWVTVEQVLRAAERHRGDFVTRMWRDTRQYVLSEFAKKIFTSKTIVRALNNTTVSPFIDEAVRKASLKQDPTDDPSWALKLSIPPKVEFKSPIIELRKESKEYNQLAALLPPEQRSRIYSIRKVDVQNRIQVFADERQRQEQDRNNFIRIVDTTLHGTPETWRATNIAYKGFDLSIRLNGRACGDGVYSATDAGIPLSYAGGKGSLLVMRGILTKKDHNNPPVLVFRGEKQVLPYAIIDFASSVDTAQAAQDEVKRKKNEEAEKRRAELKKVRNAEVEHKAVCKDRFNKMQTYFTNRMNALSRQIQSTPAEDTRSLMRLQRLAAIENRQFNAPLVPTIYADKQNLIHVLKTHDVVVLCAGTSSGKSTQVPQYLLDDVLEATSPAVSIGSRSTSASAAATADRDDGNENEEKLEGDTGDRRRVGVLEPRRFNAMALALRVSKERDQHLGMEVGYSIGQGDLCTSRSTRIEYMTHGLFVNRAMDPDSLIDQYAVIVLDEAHERTIDIDLSFALLRCALQRAKERASEDVEAADESSTTRRKKQEKKYTSFKVVVASATMSDANLEKYRDFLAPDRSGLSSTIYNVPGNSFPVMVLHRPEAEPDWSQATSVEATKALASYALDISVELLQSAECDGNVLVFLPGETNINQAMQMVSLWLANKTGAAPGRSSTSTSSSSSSAAAAAATDDDNASGGSVSLKSKPPVQKEFRLKLTNGKVITVGVFPFHGKVSEASRQRMMSHNEHGIHRMIIFSTNAAETGLTLPYIRYVVDTGLERRVVWNPVANVQTMRTGLITKSSMKQRTGRAGRECSGICVRLYSEETEKTLEDEPAPDIENGDILKIVLAMHNRKEARKRLAGETAQTDLTLMDDIPEQSKESAETLLQQLGALDESKELTELGKTLVRLGLSLRFGRFLLSAIDKGCAFSAVRMIAIATLNNPEMLLPNKTNLNAYLGSEFVDPYGDLFTLWNIFNVYCDDFSEPLERVRFCEQFDFDCDVLEEAARSYDNINTKCEALGLAVFSDTLPSSSLRQELRRALCTGFFDQLVTAVIPGSPQKKFVRVQDDASSAIFAREASSFAKKVGLSKAINVVNPNQLTSSGATTTVDNADGDASATADPLDDRFAPFKLMSMQHQSSIWMQAKLDTHNPKAIKQTLGVYVSLILTDSQQGGSLRLLTYVNHDDVTNATALIPNKIDFDALIGQLSVSSKTFTVSSKLQAMLLSYGGLLMQKYVNRFAYVTGSNNTRDKTLTITAPTAWLDHFEQIVLPKLERLALAESTPKVIELNLPHLTPDKINLLKDFFNNKNKTKSDFINKLNAILNEGGVTDDSDFQPFILSDLSHIESNRCKRGDGIKVALKVRGPAMQFASVLYGAMHSKIAQVLGETDLQPVVVVGDGRDPSAVPLIKNLSILSSKVPPSCPRDATDRQQVMVRVAHYVMWECRCKIYGGFIRDFVLRNEDANDIDCGYEPTEVNLNDLQTKIQNFVTGTLRLQVQEARQKGMAFALKLCKPGVAAFDVDLVDLSQTRGKASPPGVDCDVGNFCLRAPSEEGHLALELKVNNSRLVSLSRSQQHCQQKSFVFYFDDSAPDAEFRLKKYLARGWTCLNTLPPLLKRFAEGNASYQGLLRPDPQFDLPYHTFQKGIV